ncbi:ABC transporter permease [Parabacteroides sp. ZJ-118]|uniref:ABC transporter permease n=1 Tax=Parabacteroides sp. ZJ-118 TaxID=2709398 RepID=UPI0013EC0496|nr:ABC transporter permease [Parabacteroides sp. ZJ-118]
MFKQYVKQALHTLGENRLTSAVSILGTMLSVAMILVVVLQFQINLVGYSPVSRRDRMLYLYSVHTRSKDGGEDNNTGLSAEAVRACLYSLKTPEAVTATAWNSHVISIPGRRLFEEYTVCYTDPAFWEVFDFRFLSGRPFTEADLNSGLPRAVISDQLAGILFGSREVVGRDILVNNVMPCTIAGVVERPSRAAGEAFADVWMPYTANALYTRWGGCDGICGPFGATILARERSDVDALYAEIRQAVARYNAGKADYRLTPPRPFTHLERALGSGSHRVGWGEYLRTTGWVLLFLLLLPTLNLTGIVQSAVQKRRAEMGLRKAFGATGGRLFAQVVCENLIITWIGGLLGIGLSVVLLYAGRSFLLTSDTVITPGMLFRPLLFAAALFFTLVLNLLSAGLPALRIARERIVESLRDADE